MLAALIRKELRLQRPTVVALVIVIAATYGGIWQMLNWFSDDRRDKPYNLLSSAAFGMTLTALIAAVCGAIPLARERRERSADFAAMLPIGRRRAVATKLLVAIGIVVGAWAIHAVFALAVDLQHVESVIQHEQQRLTELHRWTPQRAKFSLLEELWWHSFAFAPAIVTAGTGMALFGIAWLIGTFARNVELAAGISLFVVLMGLVVAIQLATFRHGDGKYYQSAAVVGFVRCAAIVGAIGLIAGMWYALRRVEP